MSFSSHISSNKSNVYLDPNHNIIPPSKNALDLGIYMSSDCSFDFHIANVKKKCNNLCGYIFRTFITREPFTMLCVFKSFILSRIDYGSQLWSPHKIKDITQIERVQSSFTRHLAGMRDLSYSDRLLRLNLYSLQRRRERYCIIYVWKIIEGLVPNFTSPITCSFSERRGRYCKEPM